MRILSLFTFRIIGKTISCKPEPIELLTNEFTEELKAQTWIIVCEWLAHQIDFQSFEELIAWAATSYRVFKKSL